jgi:protein ImuA
MFETHALSVFQSPLPASEPVLEEVAACQPQDLGAALAFALMRVAGDAQPDPRPCVFVAPKVWLRERGRPFAPGWSQMGRGLILVETLDEHQALWALEEALKSGAVGGAIGALAAPDFVATRRLDFAARAGRACAVVLRVGQTGGLSTARRRWQIASMASGPNRFDARAPGPERLRASLIRRRDGAPGFWELEWDDERRSWLGSGAKAGDHGQTHSLPVAARLADHGLATGKPRPAAA